MNFGVHIIPMTNNTYSLGDSEHKWQAHLSSINGQNINDSILPAVSSSDNGQILQVNNGVWEVSNPPQIMTGATAETNGTSGLVPAPTSGDIYKFLAGDGTYRSGGLPMVILRYGQSTWSDFLEAYNNNVIVYCRASSNANPATGAQGRMAFMAYINGEPPTEVEFQYYRSIAGNNHNITQQGDQVYVYKLTSANKWTVQVRETYTRVTAGTNISATWSNGVLTINGNYSSFTGATAIADGATGLVPAPVTGDQDKFLKADGTWSNIDALPAVTSADDGKVLTVVNGQWVAAETKCNAKIYFDE